MVSETEKSNGIVSLLAQIFRQRLPILPVPATIRLLAVEMPAEAIGKSHMVHDQSGLGALRLQLELDDRVNSFRPILHAPSLDDAAIGHQLDVSTHDHA